MPRTKEAFQEMRDERKDKILQTAAEVFVRKGLANTKINDLAEAAGMSQGLLYRYFGSREDVFIALIEQIAQETINLTQEALSQPVTPWEQLRWLTDQLLLNLRQPNLRHLAEQASALPGPGSERMHEMEKALFKTVHQLIVAGQAEGKVVQRNPDQLAMLYFSCLQGLSVTIDMFGESMQSHFPDAEALLNLLKP